MTDLSQTAKEVLSRANSARRAGKTELRLTPRSLQAAVVEFCLDPDRPRLNGVRLTTN